MHNKREMAGQGNNFTERKALFFIFGINNQFLPISKICSKSKQKCPVNNLMKMPFFPSQVYNEGQKGTY